MRVSPLLLLAAITALAAPKTEFKAGVAVPDITPRGPIWMSGYAARTKPSDGVDTPLHAKALAIEDKKGHRVVIVTTDLIGLPRQITDPLSARLGLEHNLRRSQILFNSSHTHAGPVVWPNLRPMFALDDSQQKTVTEYARRLSENLFTVVSAALGKLEPVTVQYGEGTAGFAINRREFRKTGVWLGTNRKGPPIIRFRWLSFAISPASAWRSYSATPATTLHSARMSRD